MIKTPSQTSLRSNQNSQPVLQVGKLMQGGLIGFGPQRQSLNTSQKLFNQQMQPCQQTLRVSNSIQRKEAYGPSTPLKGKMNIFSAMKQVQSNNTSDLKNALNFNVYNSNQTVNFTPNDQIKLSLNNESQIQQPSQEFRSLSEYDSQSIIKENQILQQTIIKYRSEALHFKQLYTQKTQESQHEQSLNLGNLKSRIEKLEEVIDDQVKEIDEWKVKYQRTQITENQDEIYQKELIQDLEGQIMIVIQENKSLNEKIHDVEAENEMLKAKVQLMLSEITKLQDLFKSNEQGDRQKLKDQEKVIKIQKEEIRTWHETFQQYEKEQEKTISKENELFKSRQRIQELEIKLTKNVKVQRDLPEVNDETQDLKTKLQSLIIENTKLNHQLLSIKEEDGLESKDTQRTNEKSLTLKVNTLVEEINSQSLFYSEELKRFRRQSEHQKQLESQLTLARLQIISLEEEIQRLNQNRQMNQDDEIILYKEFSRSQEVVSKLLEEMQQ